MTSQAETEKLREEIEKTMSLMDELEKKFGLPADQWTSQQISEYCRMLWLERCEP